MPQIFTAERTATAERRMGGHNQNAYRVRCDCSYPLYVQSRNATQRRTCTSCRRVWDIRLTVADDGVAIRAEMYNGGRRASQRGSRRVARRTAGTRARAARTFGVELEVKNITREAASRALRAAGLDCESESYNHARRARWKATTDSSLGYGAACEVVSPPLDADGDGFAQLKTALKALRDAGARVDVDCGTHTHIGVRHFGEAAAVHAVKKYARFQTTINGFLARSRRASVWCAPISYDRVQHCTSLRGIASVQNDRYFSVNASAFIRHGTVEFRQHHGTLNYAKLSNWIRLCFGMFADREIATATSDFNALMDTVDASTEMRSFFAGRTASLEQRYR